MFNWKMFKGGVALAALAAASAVPAYAQVTTSTIRGTITTEAGAPVSGATVIVVHEPTGTTSSVATNASGVFSARNLRVGGPYTVTISGADFRTTEVTDIYVSLDESYDLSIPVSSERTLDTVVVTAPALAAGYLDTGISTNLGLEELGRVVSIDRDIADAAHLDPFVTINESFDTKEISIAGANNRYNSLTIDGIALNDRFGLNSNGYPTQRSPIPYDAIASLQVETAPYDTQFNGFTGGTINAVTQSGTNEFHGSFFYTQTNDSMAGDRLGDTQVSRDFSEENYGFTIGGPIIEDRLFFFAAYDYNEIAAALQSGPIGSGAVNERDVTQRQLDEITQIASSVYGFDTGTFGAVDPVEDEKILVNLDWNITNEHRARLSYILTEGADIREQTGNSFLTDRGVDVLGFPSSWYNRSERVEAYIAHVYSDWTPNFSTEFKYATTTQATGQDSLLGAETPLMSIRLADVDDIDGDGNVTESLANVSFGPDTFRHGNELDQEFVQYKFLATYLWGDHTFQAGFEREEVDANNLFAPSAEGQYFFNSVADFQNQQAAVLLYENAITNDENDRRAIFGYNVNSLYVQDTWDISPTLTLLGGLRYDWYEAEGLIRDNTNFQSRFGFANTTDIDGLDILMPRVGFTWTPTDALTVRGGFGRFSGGSPNVWIGNSYANDGVSNESVFATNVTVPTSPDAATGQYIPAAQLAALSGQSPDGPVNALDPDFEIPNTWKANLGFAYNVDLGTSEDWTFSFDVLYNQLAATPYWYDASCTSNGVAPDGRLTYDCSNGPEAIVLNTADDGSSLLYAFAVDKEFDNGFNLFASYTHQDIEDVSNPISAQATSSYARDARVDFEIPSAGRSRYEVEHAFKFRLSYEREFVENFPTTVSLFGTRRSGTPYSYTFAENNSPVFGTRESRADDVGHLLYVPTGPSDPLFSSASFGGDAAQTQAFFDYINNSELSQYAGGIAERNGDNNRWQTQIDLRFEQEFPGVLDGHRSFFFLDIENLGNLLNDDWGLIERRTNQYGNRQVVAAEIVGGQYVFSNFEGASRIDDDDYLNQSFWQIQLGARYEF